MLCKWNKISDQKKRFLRTLGVPPALLRSFKIETENYLKSFKITNAKGELSTYNISRQEETLQYLNDTQFDKSRVFFFECNENYLIARQVALHFFGRAIAVSRKNTIAGDSSNYPYWYYLTADVTKGACLERSGPLVVVDNASTTSQSSVRTEKLRDCINYHGDKTIIIIYQGNNSVEWSRDVLGLRPFGVVHFDGYKNAESPAAVIRI